MEAVYWPIELYNTTQFPLLLRDLGEKARLPCEAMASFQSTIRDLLIRRTQLDRRSRIQRTGARLTNYTAYGNSRGMPAWIRLRD